MKKTLLLAVIALVITLIYSCYNDNLSEMTPSSGLQDKTCDTSDEMSYQQHIVPVMENNCGSKNSCHGNSNTSGFNLSTYQGVKAVVLNGKLLSSITWTGSASHMPKDGPKMSDCTITKIQKWIDAGSLNN